MINIHIALGTVMAFIGVVAVSGVISFYTLGGLTIMSMMSDGAHPERTTALFAAATLTLFGGLTYFLGKWAGLW
jgi:hypothetical protein